MVCAYTQNLFDTFHYGVFLYLVMLLEINAESNNPCFSVLEICLKETFLHISDKTLVAHLSNQWNCFYIFQHTLFSYPCFCLLFSKLFWINSFYCWTFKSRFRNYIKWFHVCSSLYSTSQIVDSHLVTRLSPIAWYILSILSPLYNHDLMLCSSVNWYKSFIIFIILVKASNSLSWSLIFHIWLIFPICDKFFFSVNFRSP